MKERWGGAQLGLGGAEWVGRRMHFMEADASVKLHLRRFHELPPPPRPLSANHQQTREASSAPPPPLPAPSGQPTEALPSPSLPQPPAPFPPPPQSLVSEGEVIEALSTFLFDL